MTHSSEAVMPEVDGRRDFDFLFGEWRVANRKLRHPVLRGSTEWLQFEATLVSGPILDGLGNFDTYLAPEFPDRGRYSGFGLRLFDPDSRLWRIWWASTISRGQLDTPVVGRFRGGAGRFECDDVIDGRALQVRFDWTNITATSARWEQSFSFDDGKSFEPNWTMDLTRSS